MGSSTALISLVIATMAVALSLITMVVQRRQQQREAYRGLYERRIGTSGMPCCWLETMAYSQMQSPGQVSSGDEPGSGPATIQRAKSMLVKTVHGFRGRRDE
jgi:hypothetical protein